jgi:hypothetical protein
MAKKRQLGVALDDRVRGQLEALATHAGRSIADEIRQRIERSLKQDDLIQGVPKREGESVEDTISRLLFDAVMDELMSDDPTSGLASDIKGIAYDINHYSGHLWHKHPKSHAALIEAVQYLLASLTPPPLEPTTEDHWADPLSPGDPQTFGRTLAKRHQIEKARRNFQTEAEMRVWRARMLAERKKMS